MNNSTIEITTELLQAARKILLSELEPSVSLLQRRLYLPYRVALELIGKLEGDVVTPPDKFGNRKLITNTKEKEMRKELNLGNSIFPGLNDKSGLMICGYEWGLSKRDAEKIETSPLKRANTPHTFANKSLEYGPIAETWPYDKKIVEWFGLWGHPLNRKELGGDFEKSLIQTNWCDTENNRMESNYLTKLLAPENVENFLFHLEELKPKLILFMGSSLMKALQHPSTKPKVIKIIGQTTYPLKEIQKQHTGTRFKISIESFESCTIISLPHPTGSRGLSYDYIKLFTPEISDLIEQYKASRGFP